MENKKDRTRTPPRRTQDLETGVCLDASVLVSAAHGAEPFSFDSKRLLQRIQKEKVKVFLPELAVPEIVSAVMRGTRNKTLAEELAASLRLVPNFSFVSLDRTLADAAVRVITATGLKSADAVYVALALLYHVPLVTLDKEQLEKGRKLVPVQKP